MLRTYWYDTVDPFRELTSLQQWMDQSLQQTLNSFAQSPQVVSGFAPQAEVFETERPYGTFTRSFNLPSTLDVNAIHATYTNGVLQVVIAKNEAAKPKQIPGK